MQSAACIILPFSAYQPEHILSVSRKNDPTKWGIPGGKQELNESNISCAVREILEETNIVCDPSSETYWSM